MRIRVTTRAAFLEERKKQHAERGYRIEDEQATPVNGLCSFTAIREIGGDDQVDELIAEARAGKRASAARNQSARELHTTRLGSRTAEAPHNPVQFLF